MNKLFLGRRKSKILWLIGVGIALQLQFGCGLIKSASPDSPGGNSGAANSARDANQKSSNGSVEAADSEVPRICRNAYYPAGPKVERKYGIKYQKMANLNQDYAERFSNFTADGFTLNNVFKESTSNINWRCLPDGLLSTQYSNTIDFKRGGGAQIETVGSDGITYPVEARWKPGEKWTTSYNIKAAENSGGPSGGEVGATGTVKQNWQIVGTEEVTTPAGSFQTMKVKMTLTLTLNISVMGRTIPTTTSVESFAWFAKDVGIVKTTASVGGIDTATSELLSYSGTK